MQEMPPSLGAWVLIPVLLHRVIDRLNVRWDIETQSWELSGIYDSVTCDFCGAESGSLASWIPADRETATERWIARDDTARRGWIAGQAVVLAATGIDPASGPGLTFMTMPAVFQQLPFGQGLAVVFFALLVVAALSSSISLLEHLQCFLAESLGWSRRAACSLITALVMAGGVIGVIALRLTAELFIRWLEIFEHLETAGYLAVGLVGVRLLLRLIWPAFDPPEWSLLVLVACLVPAMLLVVLIVPALFTWGLPSMEAPAPAPVNWPWLALLLPAGGLLALLWQRLNQPNPWMLGPLTACALASVALDLHIGLPGWAGALGQWLYNRHPPDMPTAVGCAVIAATVPMYLLLNLPLVSVS